MGEKAYGPFSLLGWISVGFGWLLLGRWLWGFLPPFETKSSGVVLLDLERGIFWDFAENLFGEML